jgi:mRNA-degrading endonuclease YafQ of YafQ-DinJ toxin-antitoxin module
MKQIFLHKHFIKDFAKLDVSIRSAYIQRKNTLTVNLRSVELHIHPLKGEYEGCKSFNVTGNVRVIFIEIEGGYRFERIGTHSELYG